MSVKFGDFSQNATFFNLTSFKFGDSGSQPPNVKSLLQYTCKPSFIVDQVLLACNLKLREGLGRAIFISTPSHPCPFYSVLVVLQAETKLVGPIGHSLFPQECTFLGTRNSFPERNHQHCISWKGHSYTEVLVQWVIICIRVAA